MDPRKHELFEFVQALEGPVPRITFRRMLRSRAFEELCRYYVKSRLPNRSTAFAELAGKLERTFYS